jgi:hypothetical protein
MRKANGNTSDRLLEQRLAEAHMSVRERDHALELMHDADEFADAILWAKEKIASLGAIFMKPGFKN